MRGLVPALLLAAVASPAAADETSFAVKYRSATSVYLEAGRAQGLREGDRLTVTEGQATIGEIQVDYVAEHSASCRVLSETRPIREGDVALLEERPAEPSTAEAAQEAAPPEPAAEPSPSPDEGASQDEGVSPDEAPPAAPWARVRGFASLGYYRSWDNTEWDFDFEQRTARLDLRLDDITGRPLRFQLRARSRQDVRARALSQRTPRDERTDRLYELALRYEPPSGEMAVEAGRIGVSRFVGVGYLDGVLARYRPLPLLHVGAFAGRLAEIEGLGFSGTGSKYGAFVRFTPGSLHAAGPYDVMLAVSRENADGDVSREYMSLESRFGNGRRWSLFQRAEIDFNRGWREEASGESLQVSNVSLAGNIRVTSSASAFLSYDGRRNYRYYRNRLVPEEIFDDLLHQGLRAGVNYARPGGLGASLGMGASLKEEDPRYPELSRGNAWSANGGLRHLGLLSARLAVSIDGSAFSNGYTSGGAFSIRAGWRFGGGHALDLSYWRSVYQVEDTGQDRSTQWLRATGRAELARRLYLAADLEYDSGDDVKGPRAFLELGYRF